MAKPINVSGTQKRLLREHSTLGDWRAVAALYSDDAFQVNLRYVWEFAVKGIIPTSAEVRYRLGIEKRPGERKKRRVRPCRECGRLVVVRKDGTLGAHVPLDADLCKGSFQAREGAE